jgi:hypothetical protein
MHRLTFALFFFQLAACGPPVPASSNGAQSILASSTSTAGSPNSVSPANPDDAGTGSNASSAIVQFDVGHYRACAVRADGRVVCWGPGSAVSDTLAASPAPKLVAGLTDAVQVAGEDWSFCARRKGGEVSCWGTDMTAKPTNATHISELAKFGVRDETGKVFLWTDAGEKDPTLVVATPVSGLSGIRSLGSAPRGVFQLGSRCVINTQGAALCWGANGFHQLGDGTTKERRTPAEVTGLANVDEIGLSLFYSNCARIGGDLKCWGGEGRPIVTPTPFSTLHDVIRLAVGEYHACVLRRSGTVACWGHNAKGQLGTKPKDGNEVSDQPVDVPGIHDAVELELGGGEPTEGAGTTCVRVKDGTIWCSGALNDSQQPAKVDLSVH